MAKAKFSQSYTKLRRVLVAVRRAAKLKQADVATIIGKPQSYVSKIEMGERRLDVIEFVEYVRALGADPIRLLRQVLSK